MKKINQLFNVSFFVLALFSCKKETIEPLLDPTPNTPTGEKAKTYIKNKLENAKQNFTIDPNQSQQIVGAKGTVLQFSPNSFEFLNGNPVTNTINVELIEVLNYRDMMKTGITPQSSTDLLVSGGQIKVTFTSDNQEIKLKDFNSVNIYIPTDSIDYNMNVFYGTESDSSTVDWTPADSTQLNFVQDTTFVLNGTLNSYYNVFYINSTINWINCDYFYNQNPKTILTVNTSQEYNPENTVVYIYFNEINSVIRLHGQILGNENHFIIPPGYSGIPIGMNATIFAISEIGSNFAYSKVDFQVTQDYSTTLNFQEISETELELIISSL